MLNSNIATNNIVCPSTEGRHHWGLLNSCRRPPEVAVVVISGDLSWKQKARENLNFYPQFALSRTDLDGWWHPFSPFPHNVYDDNGDNDPFISHQSSMATNTVAGKPNEERPRTQFTFLGQRSTTDLILLCAWNIHSECSRGMCEAVSRRVKRIHKQVIISTVWIKSHMEILENWMNSSLFSFIIPLRSSHKHNCECIHNYETDFTKTTTTSWILIESINRNSLHNSTCRCGIFVITFQPKMDTNEQIV